MYGSAYDCKIIHRFLIITKMNKNTVTPEEVKENMQDVIVRTVEEFGKPTTYVTVQMKNGVTLRESTTCVDPADYNEKIGMEICLKRIENKIWHLLGHSLQERLAEETTRFVPLASNTPMVVSDNGVDFKIRYYHSQGKHTCVEGGHKARISLKLEQYKYMIPYDKFDPNNIEKSIEHNINKYQK